MNAAARLVHRNVLSRHLVLSRIFSLHKLSWMALGLAVVSSAIGMIYVTHQSRLLHANFQRNSTYINRLEIEYRQLLLENSTLTMPARIQYQAEMNLDMIMPDENAIQVIE
ncbi:MAG: cell division protein FtsL [Gammaproteobacteria bacterium]|nr:cell division protein FtsL [Gammaproteobacteria bacterium]